MEIPVRTALRFRRRVVLVLEPAPEPETVKITANGRDFGWLALGVNPDGAKAAPTVTTMIDEDTAEAWREAHKELQRFLSALAFHFDTHIDSGGRNGGSGEPNLLHPRGAFQRDDNASVWMEVAPVRVNVEDDERLRVALAVYREGLNATSPFLGFLAFWNALDASFNGDEASRDAFLRDEANYTAQKPQFVGSQEIANYLREDTRNAIAHVIRTKPTMTHIDPDSPLDRGRLQFDSALVRELARRAILARWPGAVTVELCSD
jgi:hypothetical protein